MLRLRYEIDLELKDEATAETFQEKLTAFCAIYDKQADVNEDSCEDLDDEDE